MIRRNKEEFYESYSYLKSECEKNGWEKIGDGLNKAGEWCKENWKKIVVCIAIAAVCIVVGAILTALTGGTFLAAIGVGLIKALMGGVISGIISVGITAVGSLIRGEDISWGDIFISFTDGFVSGFAFSGIFAGLSMALSSGVRFALAKSPQFAQNLLTKGKVNETFLKWLVPKGVKNTFVPNTNIAAGYKYFFKVGNTNIQLKWHSQDLGALLKYPGCNSGLGWTAQLQFGKKFLTTIGTLVDKRAQDIAHIPLIRWFKWR